jgi:hypothetical protein
MDRKARTNTTTNEERLSMIELHHLGFGLLIIIGLLTEAFG